jgi:hypothetical protein
MSENAVAFGINGILKRLLDDPPSSSSSSSDVKGELKVWRPLCYGAVTGMLMTIVYDGDDDV